MKRFAVSVGALACAAFVVTQAQMRVIPLDLEEGHVGLGLALRHLGNTGIFMMATAHPDDENNGLLVMLNRGQGVRTALATATRGNGGQNEIGPELFESLGVLRTEELAAIHRFDGAEQYFTRAVDFGFSFSVEETFEKWGRDEIVGDFVRLIRTIRPDVITGLMPTGDGGGQHHQASAILSREAFLAAGDPAKYPEQIAAGLRPWQPRKYYFSTGFGPPGAAPAASGRTLNINLSGYDRLLGRTYTEIGTEARSMHKCQGMAQLLSLPGPSSSSYQLVESTVPGGISRPETSLFDGVDTSIAGLAQFAGANPPAALTAGLAAIAAAVDSARKQFDTVSDEATLTPLASGLRAVRALRSQLAGMELTPAARGELDDRLGQKEGEFQQAILFANSVRIEALANDGIVVAGQPVQVSVIVANRGEADVSVAGVKFAGFDGDAPCVFTPVTSANAFGGPGGGRGGPPPQSNAAPMSGFSKDQIGRCAPTLTVPTTARVSEPYWHRAGEAGRYTFDDDAPFGLPYRPTPFGVQVALSIGGDTVTAALPIQYRYEGNIFSGEKRSELLVVPAVSVNVSPQVVIVPRAASRPGAAPAPRPAGGTTREIRVTMTNGAKTASEQVVRLEAPSGWTVAPAQQPVAFSREDESQTVRFQVTPPSGAASGDFQVKAVVAAGGAGFARGYQTIEYPHIRRQHIYRAAETRVKLIDVKTAPNLTVGYIMGVGDEVPAAIEQLGIKVEMITPDDLAWGDLSRFSTIVTGVRAYERRTDLRANNSRLLEYARNGGTVIVQYNKFEFNDAQYGPFPAKVSSTRATDEFASVTPLVADSPVFNSPNQIFDSAWTNWVQERGLYFLGEKDPRYRDLVVIDERIPNNAGEKLGALVSADVGKGRWVYVGLNLWRQLPAGVDGAYQLLANLVSLGH